MSSVSICKYELREHLPGTRPRLLSSSRLDGAAAARAISGVTAAPDGSGPNDPESCAAEWAYGDEAIVLRIRSSAGASELVDRYSGCDHNGFDDGAAVRKLTGPALAPFIGGPHRVGVPVLAV